MENTQTSPKLNISKKKRQIFYTAGFIIYQKYNRLSLAVLIVSCILYFQTCFFGKKLQNVCDVTQVFVCL